MTVRLISELKYEYINLQIRLAWITRRQFLDNYSKNLFILVGFFRVLKGNIWDTFLLKIGFTVTFHQFNETKDISLKIKIKAQDKMIKNYLYQQKNYLVRCSIHPNNTKALWDTWNKSCSIISIYYPLCVLHYHYNLSTCMGPI